MSELAQQADVLKSKSLAYLTGSHLYGLDTPESDVDLTIVYFDRNDDRRVIKLYPDVLHDETNDVKLYSLRKIAELVCKGNPNVAEMIHARHHGHTIANPARNDIYSFWSAVQFQLGTRELARAYRGHLQQIVTVMGNVNALTPKRVSHAIRVGESCLWLLNNGKVPRFRAMNKEREYALAIKCGEAPIADGLGRVQELESEIALRWAEVYAELPDNTKLTQSVNDYFIDIR